MSLADQDKKTERKKRLVALTATAGAGALAFVGWPLAVIAAVPAGFLIKDWFTYRAKRGMRF